MTSCSVCGDNNTELLYRGKIRTGEGSKYSSFDHDVVVCKTCKLARLESGEISLEDYSTGQYRREYNQDNNPASYFALHDDQETGRLAAIDMRNLRSKIVADFGCGAGSFLDFVKGVASRVIAIEPDVNYQASLASRGFDVFQGGEDALIRFRNKVDVITSFCVIEHTQSPLLYLEQCYELLKPNGVIYIETDNLDCLPMVLSCKPFKEFFFRTAHTHYFNRETLSATMARAGFLVETVTFRQIYDLSNLVLWLRDGMPTGNEKLPIFDRRINRAYQEFLEGAAMGDRLFLRASKRAT